MSTSHATLSAAADNRKARLAKLKSLKRKQPADEIVAPESTRSQSPPGEPGASPPATAVEGERRDVAKVHLSGRNYDAEAKGPKLGFEAPPTLDMQGPTLEEQAAAVEAEAKAQAEADALELEVGKGIDLFKLQPKKPNWDLKRDLGTKLEILNVRTDNAIARMVRERIANARNTARKAEGAEGAEGQGDAAGLDGIALVEGLRVRQREDEEEERRERGEVDMA